VAAPAGRREASKQATRAALLAAAQAEFAARGFDAATVRDIATTAGVTERTFYRYFDGKEGLIHEEFTSWLDLLHRAILARPPAEPPLTAVQQAMLTIGRTAEQNGGPAPLWLFSGRPGLRDLRRTAPRPLLQLESSIAAAVLTRLNGRDGEGSAGAGGPEYAARVIARVAVAAFRSAMIEHRERREAGGSDQPGLKQLLDAAFAIIGGQRAAGVSSGGPVG
jgi:AcrR family transcriptional regulator